MAYVAVSGGEEAIEASIRLLEYYRSGTEKDLDLEVIEEKMSLLVDRVMSEAGIIKQIGIKLFFTPEILKHRRFRYTRCHRNIIDRSLFISELAKARKCRIDDRVLLILVK